MNTVMLYFFGPSKFKNLKWLHCSPKNCTRQKIKFLTECILIPHYVIISFNYYNWITKWTCLFRWKNQFRINLNLKGCDALNHGDFTINKYLQNKSLNIVIPCNLKVVSDFILYHFVGEENIYNLDIWHA